jgi:hypothetical protein
MKYILLISMIAFSLKGLAQSGATYQDMNILRKLTLRGYVLRGIIANMDTDSTSVDKVPTVKAVVDWIKNRGGANGGPLVAYPDLINNTTINGNYTLTFNNSNSIFNGRLSAFGGLKLFGAPLGTPFIAGSPIGVENGDLWYNSTTGKLQVMESGVIKDVVIPGVTSSATSGFLPKMISPNVIGNSIIEESNGGIFIGGNYDNTGPYASVPVLRTGGRFLWYPSKAAFRFGVSAEGEWDRDNIGVQSFAGSGAAARGLRSFAFGAGRAFGQDATAFNFGVANSSLGTAYGLNTTAQGYAHFVVGEQNDVSGISLNSGDGFAPLFTVGNGFVSLTPPFIVNRNAFQVLRNGIIQTGRYKNNATLDSICVPDASGNWVMKYFGLPSGNAGTWGGISGNIFDQLDIISLVSDRSPIGHNHAISEVVSLQASLNAKANTSSLSPVATSGNYNDLINKPLLSEWVTLDNIAEVEAYAGIAKYIFVTDTSSGGGFYLYTGSLGANGENIIAGVSGRKWRRQYEMETLDFSSIGVMSPTDTVLSLLNGVFRKLPVSSLPFLIGSNNFSGVNSYAGTLNVPTPAPNDSSDKAAPTKLVKQLIAAITPSESGSLYDDEQARDAIGATLSAEFSYDDGANTLSINSIGQSKVANLSTDLSGKQSLDADLTTIAGLSPTTDNFIQSKSGAWSSRTPAQVKGDLLATPTDFQGQTIENYSAKYNNQTGTTYTLLASDNGKILTFNNAAAITITVPTGLPIGFNCTVLQLGAGQATFTASSTTINNRQSLTKTAGIYAVASIICITTNTFITGGDML